MFKILFTLFFILGCEEIKTVPEKPDFTKDIQPIIINKCISCHGGHWLDEWNVLDDINKIEYNIITTRKMPPGGLSKYEYETIQKWIKNNKNE